MKIDKDKHYRVTEQGVFEVPRSEALKADLVVCTPAAIPLMFPNNQTAPCTGCGRMLQFRPTAPTAPKMCSSCAYLHISPAGGTA